MRKLSLFIILLGLLEPVSLRAQHVEPIAFGDFEHWVTREIKESALLGGKTKTVYAIAPTQYIKGNKAYRNMGGSPWASSNVMANVMGIVKTSNTVETSRWRDMCLYGNRHRGLSCVGYDESSRVGERKYFFRRGERADSFDE